MSRSYMYVCTQLHPKSFKNIENHEAYKSTKDCNFTHYWVNHAFI